VQQFFGTHWQDRKDIFRYAQELEPHTFESYHKSAILRNPWDRVVSDYIYQKKKRSPRSATLCVEGDRGNTRIFKEWLEAVLAVPFVSSRLSGVRALAKESWLTIMNRTVAQQPGCSPI
jgi:hypothetical protein